MVSIMSDDVQPVALGDLDGVVTRTVVDEHGVESRKNDDDFLARYDGIRPVLNGPSA
jgi:hypothetical protein